MNNIQNAIERFAQAREAMQQVTRADFIQCFAEFFQANPAVEAIVWNQYTPYFNDGDTCTFSVHEPCIRSATLFADVDSWMGENVADRYESEDEHRPMFDALQEIFGKLPEEMFLTLFEDHVQVTLERDGKIQVDEYEHD